MFGIIAFFIEVKECGATEFNNNARKELISSIILGAFSIIIVTSPLKRLMECLMRKINGK